MSPVQGKSPPGRVKELYGNLDMVTCRLSSWNLEYTKYTPAYNACEGAWQIDRNKLCILRSVWASNRSYKILNSGLNYIAIVLCFHHAHSKDSDQTVHLPSLIRVFAGHTIFFICFDMHWLVLSFFQILGWSWLSLPQRVHYTNIYNIDDPVISEFRLTLRGKRVSV